MAELFYQTERDCAFIDACEKAIKTHARTMTIPDIIEYVRTQPTTSFFVSPQGYLKIFSGYAPTSLAKQELREDVLSRYTHFKDTTGMSDAEIADIMDRQEAPRFYMSSRRAMDLYYRLLKNDPRK